MITSMILAAAISMPQEPPKPQIDITPLPNITYVTKAKTTPTPAKEVQYIVPALIPTIFVRDFDEVPAKMFVDQMDAVINSGADTVLISIDSYGGGVYALLMMLNKIEAAQKLGIKVATVVEGKAMSCGAVLFSAGTEGLRFVGPYSTILIHSVSAGAQGKVAEMVNRVNEAARLNDVLFTILAKKTGKPENFYLDVVKAKGDLDWFISPKEAVSLGLANKIKVPELKTKVILENVIE